MEKESRIYIAGHNGLVGSAIVQTLHDRGFHNLVLYTHGEADLTVQSEVDELFKVNEPEYVFLASAKVGGLKSNMSSPGEFIRDNLLIQLHVMEAARIYRVKKLLFLGSSCIYPRECFQPIKEEYLMTSSLEPTNSAYALAKIAGIEICKSYRKQWGCNFISAMPPNLYGKYDNFNLKNSHVMAAIIRKFHEAKVNKVEAVELWGDGTPQREFLHVDDLAEALLFLMDNYDEAEHINVGTGEDIPIRLLAPMIKAIVGYEGKILWDVSMPNGTPKKLLDVHRINELGWHHKISLEEGIRKTYEWFVDNYEGIKK